MVRQKVLVIVGPTASGKSELAVKLALRLRLGQAKKSGFNGAEIISADSRQVYKGLDIGTGKISRYGRRGIPHHLLDVADPKKQFSVSDFLILTNQAIAEIVNKGKMPMVVGGTGFYIDAVTGRTNFPDVPPNKSLRDRLNKLDKEELFKILKKKDRARARSIDPKNKVRLIRALEIVKALGKIPRSRCQPDRLTPYGFIYIGLEPDNLNERIYKRLIKRLPDIIREAQKLVGLKRISYKRMHELGLEYRYIGMYLQGKISKEEMANKLFTEIRRYAKRQMTWFKRNKKIKWFKLQDYREIEKYVMNKL